MTDFTMERRRILQRIIKKIASGPFHYSKDYLTTASKLTGLNIKVLNELQTADTFEFKIESVDRSVIYEKLVHFYTIENKMPTTYELFNSLYKQLPPYVDIGNFKKMLVKMDFVWMKVSPSCAVVIEKPLVRFERYNYLKKIQFYRSTNADVYYIDDGSYDSKGNFRDAKLAKEYAVDVSQKVIYAVGPSGIHALEEIDDVNCKSVWKWVRDELLPTVAKPSVFIINNNEHYSGKLFETPTLDGLKSDTERWLDKHGITYDPEMSKYVLFDLAEKYTDLTKVFFEIDEIIKSKGHIVLRIPKCIQNVTSAAMLARIIDVNFSNVVVEKEQKSKKKSVLAAKEMFKEFIAGVGLMYINEFEMYISHKERELIQMEDRVDHVYAMLIDKVVIKPKDKNLEDSDLPSCSDSE